MPRHATKTSFAPGHKRSPESIEKQRATLRARGKPLQLGNAWTQAQHLRHANTKRWRALGHVRMSNGYRQVMTANGYRYEHRLIMEGILGRPLLRSEVVHHKNEDKTDNRPDNLELMHDVDHLKHHASKYRQGRRS